LCAQHGRDEEVRILWGSWSQRPRANRKVKKPGLTRSGREAGAERSGSGNREPTNRKHPSKQLGCGGYKALRARVSGQVTAKLCDQGRAA